LLVTVCFLFALILVVHKKRERGVGPCSLLLQSYGYEVLTADC